MQKNTIKTMVICALIIGVGGLTLGYAALNQMLTINTNATVKNASDSWNIHFKSVDSVETFGTYAEGGTTSISGTALTIKDAVFKAPGDIIAYTFTVENLGTIAADLTSYQIFGLDENSPIEAYFTAGQYQSSDGSGSACFINLEKNSTFFNVNTTEFSNNHLNGVGYNMNGIEGHNVTRQSFTFVLKLSDNYELPTTDLTLSNFGIYLNYRQGNNVDSKGDTYPDGTNICLKNAS